MARVEPPDVALLVPDATTTEIQFAIDDASQWIDDNLVGRCSQITEAAFAIIEKYLAAHLLVGKDESGGQLIEAARADISERYAERDSGEANEFIKIAAAMDPCAIVAERWLGKLRAVAFVGKGYA